jgi:hypothetical protein
VNQPDPAFEAALEAYHQACLAVLDLLQEESDALQSARLDALPGFAERRKVLLGRLESTQKATRTAAPTTIPGSLKPRIQATADLIQRAVKLDRQNEQWWLRHRLVPPEMIPNSASRNPRRVRSTYGFAGDTSSP